MKAARPWIQACRPDRAFLAPCCVAVGSSYAGFDAQDGPGLPAHVLVSLGAFAAALGANFLAHAWSAAGESSRDGSRPLPAVEAAVGGGVALTLAALCALGLVPLSGGAAAGYGALAILVGALRRAPVVGLDALGRGAGELASVASFGPLAALAGFASQAGTGSWGCVLAGIPAGLAAAGALADSRTSTLGIGNGGSLKWGVVLPLLAAATVVLVARAGEYGPWSRLAVVPLAATAIAQWRAPAATAPGETERHERVTLACAVLALGVIVAALRFASAD